MTSKALLQIPVIPLQRAGDGPLVFNQTQMDHSDGTLDAPPEKGIPTLITWSHGGNEILLEGSWDNWTSRLNLGHKTETDLNFLFFVC